MRTSDDNLVVTQGHLSRNISLDDFDNVTSTSDWRQSKTLLRIDEHGSKLLEAVFSIAICRQSVYKWQSKLCF